MLRVDFQSGQEWKQGDQLGGYCNSPGQGKMAHKVKDISLEGLLSSNTRIHPHLANTHKSSSDCTQQSPVHTRLEAMIGPKQ